MSLQRLINEGEEALRRMRAKRVREMREKLPKAKKKRKKKAETKRSAPKRKTEAKRTTKRKATKRKATKRKTTPKCLPKNRRYMIRMRDGRWRFATHARYKAHKGKKKVVQLD